MDFLRKLLGKKQLDHPSPVDPLIIALHDEDRNVRESAVETLGKLGGPRAIEHLVSASIKDIHEVVRWRAAEILRELGDPHAVELLITALKDSEWVVRWRAAEVLGIVGDPLSVEPLIAALSDNHWSVRKQVAWVLGNLGDHRAIQPLVAAIKDDDETVREAVAEALDKLRGKLTQDENSTLRENVRAIEYTCPHCGSELEEDSLMTVRLGLQDAESVDFQVNCSSCGKASTKKDFVFISGE